MTHACLRPLKIMILAPLLYAIAAGCMPVRQGSTLMDATQTPTAAPKVLGQGIPVRTDFATTHALQLQSFPELTVMETAYPETAAIGSSMIKSSSFNYMGQFRLTSSAPNLQTYLNQSPIFSGKDLAPTAQAQRIETLFNPGMSRLMSDISNTALSDSERIANCFGSVMFALGKVSAPTSYTSGEIRVLLSSTQEIDPLREKMRAGDIIVIREGHIQHDWLHTAVYLFNDLVFAKLGPNRDAPYVVESFEQLTKRLSAGDAYFDDPQIGPDYRLHVLRF